MKLQNKMRYMSLDAKTGFRNVTGSRVQILDDEMKPFYDSSIVFSKVWEFNLPAGNYYIKEGKIRQRIKPIEYELPKLPPRERYLRSNPEAFPIIYAPNKFTCSVFWDAERSPYGKQVIVFDPSAQNLSLPELTFMLYHEFGHRYWGDGEINEAICDAYAKNRMLLEGFNPSQIGNAINHTLSDKNEYRKEILIDSLITK